MGRWIIILWSLWLVFSLLGWDRWAWQSFNAGGMWRSGATEENVVSSRWNLLKYAIVLLVLVALAGMLKDIF